MHAQSPLQHSGAGPDSRRFEEFYREWHRPVVGMCRRLVGAGEAEAVAQEVFLRAWLSFDHFDEGRPFGPWITTIARRTCLNHLRDRARRAVVSRTEALPAEVSDSSEDDPFEAIAGADALGRALGRLSPRDRRLLRLCHVGGWSYDEIARAERVTADAVRGSLKRARHAFRCLYDGMHDSRLGALAGPLAVVGRLRARLARSIDRWAPVVAPRAMGAELVAGVALTMLATGGVPAVEAPATSTNPETVTIAAPLAAIGEPSTEIESTGGDVRESEKAAPPTTTGVERADAADAVDPAVGSAYEFTASPSYEEDSTVFASSGSTLLKSTDGGATWTRLPARGLTGGRILLPPAYPADGRIFAATGVLLSVSVDGGASFEVIGPTSGPATMSPLFSSGDPRILFGLVQPDLAPVPTQYRDTEASIAPLHVPLPAGAAPVQFAFAPSYADDGRVFVSAYQLDRRDMGSNLGSISAGPLKKFSRLYSCTEESCELAFEVDGLVPNLSWSSARTGTGFAWTGTTLHRTTDGGRSFTGVRRPWERGVLRGLDIGRDGTVYATVLHTRDFMGELFVSHDDGDSWVPVSRQPTEFRDVVVLPDGALLASHWRQEHAGIRCSVDGGRTWADRCPRRR